MAYSFQTYLPFYRRNLRVAFPVILTQIGAALVGLADSIMVGHYGTTDLAAVSFSNAIFFTVMVFSMGALMGVTPLVGHIHGRIERLIQEGTTEDELNHEHCQIASLFANGMVFTGIMSILAFALLIPCIPLLDKFGQDSDVSICARPYFILVILSIVPFLLFTLCKQFLEGLNNTTIAMVITIGCNLLNVGLNWIFIFGHFGIQAMGATGAGVATLICRTLMPICFFVVILWRREWRKYVLAISRNMVSACELGRLFRIGTPIGLQSFVECFLFTASFVIIGWINKEALAAHHIANQMAELTFMIAQGIGAATTIRVSHQLGKGDLNAVQMAAKASIHLCLLMNTLGAAFMIVFRHQLPYVFTNDSLVVPIASSLLLIAGLFQYADGLQCIGAAMLRGIQDVRVPMRIAVFAYIAVALPLGIVLTFSVGLGAQGMWLAFVIGLAIPAVLFHVRFCRQMKRMKFNKSINYDK